MNVTHFSFMLKHTKFCSKSFATSSFFSFKGLHDAFTPFVIQEHLSKIIVHSVAYEIADQCIISDFNSMYFIDPSEKRRMLGDTYSPLATCLFLMPNHNCLKDKLLFLITTVSTTLIILIYTFEIAINWPQIITQ